MCSQLSDMNRGSGSSSNLLDTKLEEHQVCRPIHCPNCGHKLDRKPNWVGLPAGVKFDPSDQELIEHLEKKVTSDESRSHPLIDEFIATIEGEDGICYTHPEKFPGVTRDGLSKHFFHRPSKAYTTGTRKRRKIQTECDLQRSGETRWHKTGKTRPVMVNGKQRGCKKILVLYTNFGKHRKPEKTNWVMHQYHLGELEEEKEGELVVSKIFYQTQPRQCNWSTATAAANTTATSDHYRVVMDTVTTGGDQFVGLEHRRDSTGSGSCSSSKDVVSHRDHEIMSSSGASGKILSYGEHVHHLKPDTFSFAPFRKSFDEVGLEEAASMVRNALANTREDREGAAAAFHVSRPTIPISTILPPASASLNQTSIAHDDPYNVSRMLLNATKFNEQQQQQHQRAPERSASGLEELIMGCTSSGGKAETSLPHTQEAEWLKYSYWLPDNPDHHV